MLTRLTFSVLAVSLSTSVLVASTASAHSDYWRCAAASGSNEAAAANCGSRSDYDRTGELGGANAPSDAQRQQRRDEEERQRQDNIRREEEDRRRDQTRRDDDDRRRRQTEQDEEDARRRRNNEDSYERESRSTRSTPSTPSRRERQVETPVVYEDVVVPVEVNLNQPSINLGTVLNVAGNRGLRVKAITVETSTPGGSRVNVLASGVRVGSIVAQQPGEYEKSFNVPRSLAKAGGRLALATQGDVTVLRVTLTVGR
jgi:hypothetical protein